MWRESREIPMIATDEEDWIMVYQSKSQQRVLRLSRVD